MPYMFFSVENKERMETIRELGESGDELLTRLSDSWDECQREGDDGK